MRIAYLIINEDKTKSYLFTDKRKTNRKIKELDNKYFFL